jgi:hypothetical protein
MAAWRSGLAAFAFVALIVVCGSSVRAMNGTFWK